jgi:hypothetical protein
MSGCTRRRKGTPDGGWNCDPRATGRRSSFHESLIPMHGLFEYGATHAASRTAELLLDHRLFRRTDTGEPIHPEWIRLHHPPRWHYDILHALTVLARMARAADERPLARRRDDHAQGAPHPGPRRPLITRR